jgi:ATP-dependent protease ClpP protease subunit
MSEKEASMEILQFAMPFWGDNHKLPDPDLLMLYKGFESRHLWLDCEITLETCSLLVKYIHHLNMTEPFDATPITLHLFSPGGELDTMFMLYSTLKQSIIPIHTINEGRCHSAAFIVFLAGSKRTMNRYGTFVAHEGSGVVGGTFKETKQAMAQYEKDVHQMAEIIANETDLKIEEIKKRFDLDSDWYISYSDATKFGIIRE